MKKKQEQRAKKQFKRIIYGMTAVCFLVFGVRAAKFVYNEAITVFGHKNDVAIDLSKDVKEGIPQLYQMDQRWGKRPYGTSNMEISGCGPTCLSMVYCGLTKDTRWNPYEVAKMAEKYKYYVPGSGTSWTLMTEGAKRIGLKAEEIVLSETVIRRELEEGRPIICAMRPGDFTTEGHFIVLTGVNSDGNIMVNDPNSKSLSEKAWDLEVLMGQMKNLWSYSVK